MKPSGFQNPPCLSPSPSRSINFLPETYISLPHSASTPINPPVPYLTASSNFGGDFNHVISIAFIGWQCDLISPSIGDLGIISRGFGELGRLLWRLLRDVFFWWRMAGIHRWREWERKIRAVSRTFSKGKVFRRLALWVFSYQECSHSSRYLTSISRKEWSSHHHDLSYSPPQIVSLLHAFSPQISVIALNVIGR